MNYVALTDSEVVLVIFISYFIYKQNLHESAHDLLRLRKILGLPGTRKMLCENFLL